MAVWPDDSQDREYPGVVARRIEIRVELTREGVRFTGDLHDTWIAEDDEAAEDIHHFRLAVVATGPHLRIASIAAEPIAHPYPECPGASAALQTLIGESFDNVFARRAKTVLGGRDGCTHVLTLLLEMCSARVPASYLIARSDQVAGRPPRYRRPERPIDVCFGWREGGTAARFHNIGRRYMRHIDRLFLDPPAEDAPSAEP